MTYWLMKSEPGTWSWDDQVRARTTTWDGVRNHQAANNMKAMKRGDLAFFYHSGEEKSIVGIVEVIGEYRPDPSDASGRFGMVEVAAVKPMQRP
ncbi:MAG TPA: EVE domain-containing protein, partial [Kiloniellales bacterium]